MSRWQVWPDRGDSRGRDSNERRGYRSTMAGRLSEAWQWWIDGLVDAVLLVEDRLRRDRPLRLVPVGDGYAIERNTGRRTRHVLRTAGALGGSSLQPARLARRLKGRTVDVVSRPEQMLTRKIGPLPPESRAYVEGIVTHQLERMTPWLAADTLSTHTISTVAPDDPRLMVTVDATSRAMHAALLEALTAIGPKELRLVRQGADGRADVVLPIAAIDRGAKRRRIGSFLQIGLAVIAVAAALGTWQLMAASDDLAEQIAEVEDHIADYAKRLEPVTASGRSDRDVIAVLSRDTPMAVLALEHLSDVLPDEAHLTELQIGRGRLHLVGVTRDIAALTTEIEAAAVFADPVFSAPTVRLREGDRFTLDLRIAGGERSR